MELKVIEGGFIKGSWLRDRSAYTDDEIAEGNAKFRELSERYPQYRSFFEYLIWDIKPKPTLKLVK